MYMSVCTHAGTPWSHHWPIDGWAYDPEKLVGGAIYIFTFIDRHPPLDTHPHSTFESSSLVLMPSSLLILVSQSAVNINMNFRESSGDLVGVGANIVTNRLQCNRRLDSGSPEPANAGAGSPACIRPCSTVAPYSGTP